VGYFIENVLPKTGSSAIPKEILEKYWLFSYPKAHFTECPAIEQSIVHKPHVKCLWVHQIEKTLSTPNYKIFKLVRALWLVESRVCISPAARVCTDLLSNSPNHISVFISLCKHSKCVLFVNYKRWNQEASWELNISLSLCKLFLHVGMSVIRSCSQYTYTVYICIYSYVCMYMYTYMFY
jgi:hypothetical protein